MSTGSDRYTTIRKHCATTAKRLFDDFDRKRKNILTEVAREFYPLGVAGLTKSCEELADEVPYEEDHRILSTQPLDALRKGACGFHGNLTSPARRWFRFRATGNKEDGSEVSLDTLDHMTEACEFVMRRSTVYPAVYKLYEHLLWAGFGCMLVTRDARDVVKAQTLRIGTYAMGVGPDGAVCRVVRRFSWNAEQILKAFGDDGAPEGVRKAAKENNTTPRWTVYNLIEPNATGDMKAYDKIAQLLKLDDSMTYRSVYWLEKANDEDPQAGVLEISGFTVKPIVAPRMDFELGDTYGRGRGLDALCVARGVQSFQYDILNISGLKGKPPLIASSEFKDEGFRAGRGQVNYARFGEQRQALAYPVFAQPPETTEIRADRQDAQAEIADIFFNSAFATIDALKNNPGVKTATEVDALVRESMERLNPVITNLDRELLDPLVTVVLRYALAYKVAPLTDEDVAATDLVDIEYVSQIHLAAKASQLGSLDSWLSRIGAAADAMPQILDKVDVDAVADEFADMLGVPASVRMKDDKVAAVRQQRAEQMQKQVQMQQLDALGKASRIGAMPTDDKHLGGIVAGLQGDGTRGMMQ